MNRVCLVVLIGLPGAGKTTFCNHLMQMKVLPFNILHVCYDDLINFNSGTITHYKKERENILNFLKATAIQLKTFVNMSEKLQSMHYRSHQNNDTIILCDDNHYYRSMRYKVFQIAREQNLGYCQLYFNCKPQFALERNGLRNASQKVPNDVVLKMCCRLEVPNGAEHQWEEASMILQASNSLDKQFNEIVSFIAQAMNNPVQLPQHTFPKSPITQSKVHELDLSLRKHIKCLMEANENRSSLLAKKLNEKRKETLALFQKDIACSSENINIEKYVKSFTID